MSENFCGKCGIEYADGEEEMVSQWCGRADCPNKSKIEGKVLCDSIITDNGIARNRICFTEGDFWDDCLELHLIGRRTVRVIVIDVTEQLAHQRERDLQAEYDGI